MRSNIFKEARFSLLMLTLVLVCSMLFYFFASMFTSMGYAGYKKAREANAKMTDIDSVTVIIDAGHGGEDPGATANGLIEKDLNLEISLELEKLLNACGYKTLLTRNSDTLLYNSGEENRKKYYDLRNREAIAERCGNAIFISIHMNKFPVDYCKGLQTFYSENNSESKLLADSIQSNVRILQTDNKRAVKSGNDTIYLLDNLDMPAVLIECGFLSNCEEASLLSNNDYKASLTFSIYCGIAELLEKQNEK